MACQAIGRCRICARKHKIAVFGGEKGHHFFIEEANLKLIILNTVCIDCIDKIELLVKKIDLDTFLRDYKKDENYQHENKSKTMVSDSNQGMDDSSKSMTIKVDQPSLQHEENSIESKTSLESCTSSSLSNHIANTTDTQARRQHPGDSQLAITTLRHSSRQDTSAGMEPLNKPNRKRRMNMSEKHLEEEETDRNAKNDSLASNSSSTISSSTLKIGVVNREPTESASEVKKGSRSLRCDFCEKEFTHAGDLNKHRRKHTGEKPYQCNRCYRKFAHTSNLARHQRVHSGERPFSCTRCERTFTRRDKLTVHVSASKCQKNTNDSNPYELSSPKRIKT